MLNKIYKINNTNNQVIDTSNFDGNHGDFNIIELKQKLCEFVGAKYCCVVSNASQLLNIALLGVAQNVPQQLLRMHPIYVPSLTASRIPTSVENSGIPACWVDDIDTIGLPSLVYDTSAIFHRTGKDEQYPAFQIWDFSDYMQKDCFNYFCQDDDIAVFNFGYNSPMNGFSGGAMVTNDESKAIYFQTCCNLGYDFMKNEQTGEIRQGLVMPGFDLRPDSLMIKSAMVNLGLLEKKNERLAEIKQEYDKFFLECGLQSERKSKIPLRDMYCIEVPEDKRDSLSVKINKEGISTAIHYPPCHLYNFYNFTFPQSFSKSIQEFKTTLTIPFNESLTDEDVKFLCENIRRVYEGL